MVSFKKEYKKPEKLFQPFFTVSHSLHVMFDQKRNYWINNSKNWKGFSVPGWWSASRQWKGNFLNHSAPYCCFFPLEISQIIYGFSTKIFQTSPLVSPWDKKKCVEWEGVVLVVLNFWSISPFFTGVDFIRAKTTQYFQCLNHREEKTEKQAEDLWDLLTKLINLS